MRSIAQLAGLLLIAFGMMAGASTAAAFAQAKRHNVPERERFWQAVGGALCGLTCGGSGVLLVALGSRKPRGPRPRRSGPDAQLPSDRKGRNASRD